MVSIGKRRQEVSYTLILRMLLILVAVIISLKLSSFSIFVVGAMIATVLFQRNIEHAFFAIVLLVSLAIMNNVFFEKGFNFYLVTRGTLFLLAVVMSIKKGGGRGAWFLAPFAWLYAYIFFMALSSIYGWCPVISELKALLFFVFITAMVAMVSVVVQSGVDASGIRATILMVACFYVFGSIASVPFPTIGKSMMFSKMETWGVYDYEIRGFGLFNGMTWHSQALGPVVAILNAFLVSDYMCNIKRRDFLYWALFACIPILVYLTSSRTALFAYIISIVTSAFFIMNERRVSNAKKNRMVSNLIFMIVLFALVITLRPGGIERVEAFLRKAEDVENVDRSVSMGESLTSSRMGLAESGLNNFRKSPLIGNGFQVSEQMKYLDTSEVGSMLSAPIEKGVLPVMVLEEGGVIGALLFSGFLVTLYVKYRKLQFTCFLSTFTVFLALNTGEAVFFSTSGGGGILWMICFCALILDVIRHRRMLIERHEKLTGEFLLRSGGIL